MTHYIPNYSPKATQGILIKYALNDTHTYTTPWFIGYLRFLSTIPLYMAFIFPVQYVGRPIYSTYSIDVYYFEVGSA